MHTSSLRRLNDGLRIGVLIKASNINSHCSIKKFDVLWQISDVLTKRLRRPLMVRRAVESDSTARWLPNTDDGAHERRFSRTAGPDNCQTLSTFELEGHVVYY